MSENLYIQISPVDSAPEALQMMKPMNTRYVGWMNLTTTDMSDYATARSIANALGCKRQGEYTGEDIGMDPTSTYYVFYGG